MVTLLRMKRGEGKTATFTITDNGSPLNVSAATQTFTLKRRKSNDDLDIIFQKDDTDFDKTNAATGIVKVAISETDSDIDAGKYYGELKTYFSANAVDKSDDIILTIEQDVY